MPRNKNKCEMCGRPVAAVIKNKDKRVRVCVACANYIRATRPERKRIEIHGRVIK
jgi:ribosome-binding protein aMBF1 (putative translation factor)